MKKIGILGSTGSIGTQTLDVIDNLSNKFDIKYLSAYSSVKELARQALKYNPDTVCIVDESLRNELSSYLKNTDISITSGRSSLLELAGRNDVDLVMNGLVGASGMEPTIESIKSGVDVALSNKESLVMAGGIIKKLLKLNSCNLFPVDSEHSAIWQCLQGEKNSQIKRIILTGSGGPFRNRNKDTFRSITLKEALKHPNWNMGNKITIDSATMMNKGLEVIEAYWLFEIETSQIEIIIHPESIIHSMVEFLDGSVKAQMGIPDMKIPIQYSLSYPDHSPASWENLNLSKIKTLNFEEPDIIKFPCIKLAYDALKSGGSNPIVLNVANDNAVDAFLKGHIQFLQIPILIEEAISNHEWFENPSLEDISELTNWTNNFIKKEITTHA
tara:strand:+ start:1797 stop:2954 length:1158 start_codon:yes stop_codon:yes gene_type:complete